jgi:hypothetical protein
MPRRLPSNRCSVHQRPHAFNARRKNDSRVKAILAVTMFALVCCFPPGFLQNQLVLLGIMSVAAYMNEIHHVPLPIRDLQRKHRRIRDYGAAEFKLKFGFHQEHATRLLNCMNLGDIIRCENGSVCNSEEAMLIMLNRLTHTRKLTDMESEFGIDYTQICRIFNTTINIFVDRNSHLLFDNLNFFVPRLQSYNLAIKKNYVYK